MFTFLLQKLELEMNRYIFRGWRGGHLMFSSHGWSPGRAIVLPPASALAAASALAKCLMLKFLCDGQGPVRRAILSL